MIRCSRANLEDTLSQLSKIAGTNITTTEIKDLSDSRLIDYINCLLKRFNCNPFSEKEKRDLIYKKQ